jgi:hypothetical protein
MSSKPSKYLAGIVLGLLCISGASFARADDVKTEANIPQTLAELDRWYAVPATNGAGFFLRAYQIISNNVPLRHYTNESGHIGGYIDWPEIPLTNGPLPRAVKSSLTPFVRAVDLAWPVLEQGAKCGPCRYPMDLTQGWNASLLHLRDLTRVCLGCQLRAISEADARHPDAALDSVLMGLAVAQSLKLEPLEISQEVRCSMQSRAVNTLEQVINRVSLPLNRLDRLQEVFNQLEMEETKGDDFERGLVGSKLIDLSYFDSSSNQLCQIATNLIGNWTTNYTVQQIPQLIAKGWKTQDADRKLMGDTFDKMLSIWKEGYPKRFEIDEIFNTRIVDLAQRQFGFLILTSMESLPAEATREGKVVIRLRLAQTAVALERYRARHQNQYPDSLSALVPDFLQAIPEDIFNGSALQYHRRADGYVLYSIGSNRTDDGGTQTEDIVFRAIHPPGRAVME